MTILEKIKNLYWYNEIVKLREILTDLYNNSIGNIPEAPVDGKQYARQDATWTEVSGGGGSQDLQSVLDLGKYASYDGDNSFVGLLTGDENDRNIELGTGDGIEFNAGVQINNHFSIIKGAKLSELISGSVRVEDGQVILTQLGDGVRTEVRFETPIATTESGAILNFPAKSDGTYTVATLEDIYAVGALIPTYADNAAAVTGGLALHGLYKTATGEIRVRV